MKDVLKTCYTSSIPIYVNMFVNTMQYRGYARAAMKKMLGAHNFCSGIVNTTLLQIAYLEQAG